MLGPWKDFVRALAEETDMQKTEPATNIRAITEGELVLRDMNESEFNNMLFSATP